MYSMHNVMRMRLASSAYFVEREEDGMATPLVVAIGHYQSYRDKNTVHEQKLRDS